MESSGGGFDFMRRLTGAVIEITKDKNVSIVFQRDDKGGLVVIVVWSVNNQTFKSSTRFDLLDMAYGSTDGLCEKIVDDLKMCFPPTKQGN